MPLIVALFLFIYPFMIYPPLLSLLARRYGRKPNRRMEPSELPSVALVISAYNEQNVIERKLENCLALRYPRGKLRVIVVCDGCTDGTAALSRGFQGARVQVLEHRERRGKPARLNEIVPQLAEQIIVLSDANVMYNPSAVRKLVARFADPSVGCVSGRVSVVESTDLLDGATGSYYSLEWSLFEKSSALYSMPGTDGAMYALRRELFQACPEGTIIDDFVIGMAVVRQGRRAVFEPQALGWEWGPASLREEFRRKVRIAAGSLQALLNGAAWPRNAPPRFWFVFLSHKVLRWISPVSGAAAIVLAAAAPRQPLSQLVLWGGSLMFFSATLRLALPRARPILNAPFYFVFGQISIAVGLLKGLFGRQTVLWAKANR